MRVLLLLATVLSCVIAAPARADRLDDDLDTVWEATWDQRGTPQRLRRWEQPIRWRIGGADAKRHRETVLAALTAAAQAAGVAMSEAAAEETANFEIDIGQQDALPDSVGCDTQAPHTGFAITRVRLRLRASQAWSCVHHEVMHAMGVLGHPSGRTVLSYFPWRKDVLMELDRLMLAAWYDRALPRGATPFDVLWSASQRVVKQPELGLDAAQAQQRRQAHYDRRIADMKAFAAGEGDVPTIIKRSGRASTAHIDEARVTMAYFLGSAHQRGVGMARDDTQAMHWYKQAAQRAHDPSQVQLARALLRGGATADRVEAHRWLAAAARTGNDFAIRELAQLEERMDPDALAKARALGPYTSASAPAAP